MLQRLYPAFCATHITTNKQVSSITVIVYLLPLQCDIRQELVQLRDKLIENTANQKHHNNPHRSTHMYKNDSSPQSLESCGTCSRCTVGCVPVLMPVVCGPAAAAGRGLTTASLTLACGIVSNFAVVFRSGVRHLAV